MGSEEAFKVSTSQEKNTTVGKRDHYSSVAGRSARGALPFPNSLGSSAVALRSPKCLISVCKAGPIETIKLESLKPRNPKVQANTKSYSVNRLSQAKRCADKNCCLSGALDQLVILALVEDTDARSGVFRLARVRLILGQISFYTGDHASNFPEAKS